MCFVPKLLPPIFPMQTDPRSIIPSDATPTVEKNASKHRTSTVSRGLFQNSKSNNVAGAYISTRQLLNAATKRVRTRSQQVCRSKPDL